MTGFEPEVPAKYRHFLERDGLVTVGHLPIRRAQRAIIGAVPTMHHAAELLDALIAALGDRAWIDPSWTAYDRRVYVRDSDRAEWIVATSVLEHRFVDRHELKIALSADASAPAPRPAPDIVPEGPLMRTGDLFLREGSACLQIGYDERGLLREVLETGGDFFVCGYRAETVPHTIDPLARPPTVMPHSVLCRADIPDPSWSIDQLAQLLANLNPVARVPARLRVPAPLPLGAEGVRMRAIDALREACFRGVIPDAARFAVADGFDGVALGWGATAEEAIAHWEQEVFRKKPRPPQAPSAPPPDDDEPKPIPRIGNDRPREFRSPDGKTVGFSTGMMTLGGIGGGGVPWPAAIPTNVPALLIPLPAVPEAVPAAFARVGFDRCVRIVSALGEVHYALMRETPRGFTLIGEHVLDIVDPDPEALEAEIDKADADKREFFRSAGAPSAWDDPQYRTAMLYYRCFDSGHRKRIPCEFDSGEHSAAFSLRSLDGDRLPWGVARFTRLR